MPRLDRYHDSVKKALIKDGWTITHDPLRVPWGTKDLYMDLGAERLLAAERGRQKIAIEIKTFGGRSEMQDLEIALGQYFVDRALLAQVEANRELYLAVSEEVYHGIFEEAVGRLMLQEYSLRLIVFDPDGEVVRRWIP